MYERARKRDDITEKRDNTDKRKEKEEGACLVTGEDWRRRVDSSRWVVCSLVPNNTNKHPMHCA